MSKLDIGTKIVQTSPIGRRTLHTVLALDRPPSNPSAPAGPYVELSDPSSEGTLLLREQDILEANWLEILPADGEGTS